MGHNNNYTNYSKIINYNSNSKELNNEIDVTDTTDTTDVDINMDKKNVSEEPIHYKKGIVVKCEKLNIRKEASIDSKIIGLLHKNECVTIHKYPIESEDFYLITTDNAIKGYCMKKYIEILENN